MVSIASAFDQLLNENKTKKLRIAFLKALADVPPKEPIFDRRDIPAQTRRKGLRDLWMEQFLIVRGHLARGHQPDAYRSYWSREEHLLLAAFIFPMLAKLWLRDSGLHALTEEDEEVLYAFDYLLGIKSLFKMGEDETHMPIYGWVKAMRTAEREWRRQRRRVAGIGALDRDGW
jgi:hypothetical protein